MKYKWEPIFDYETCAWYCQKLVYMNLPQTIGYFDTEKEAIDKCKELNKGESNV